MKKFISVDDVPDFPISKSKEEHLKHCKEFIEAGAIPKSKLEVGASYIGACRNASEATWNGKNFTYMRTKFWHTYPEDINHFEDDDGYDVFIPIKKKKT